MLGTIPDDLHIQFPVAKYFATKLITTKSYTEIKLVKACLIYRNLGIS